MTLEGFVLAVLFWIGLFFVGSMLVIFTLIYLAGRYLGPVAPSTATTFEADKGKPIKQSIKKEKPAKPTWGSWGWYLEQQKKENARQKNLARQAEANRICQAQRARERKEWGCW